MLAFLFRGLTAQRPDGAALFEALTAEARRPDWYVEGGIPDSLDGRFAVLAAVTALALVRLERDGEAGNRASVALTERFIAVMESEHRELGLGDPSLGKTVRKLVGMLARRTDLLRRAVSGETDWSSATRDSLYKSAPPPDALEHAAAGLRSLYVRLERMSLDQLEQGRIG
jgi:cytochrome b pre-mRNA-processing protein 3